MRDAWGERRSSFAACLWPSRQTYKRITAPTYCVPTNCRHGSEPCPLYNVLMGMVWRIVQRPLQHPFSTLLPHSSRFPRGEPQERWLHSQPKGWSTCKRGSQSAHFLPLITMIGSEAVMWPAVAQLGVRRVILLTLAGKGKQRRTLIFQLGY